MTTGYVMAKKIEKPWGYELLWSHTDHYAGKLIHINPGSRLSLQYHERKHESVLVLSGTLLLHLGQGDDARIKELSPGESYDISVGDIHRFAAPSDTDVEIIEVSTPELDDVIRLEDDYQRAGT
ncbi:MAG: cupin domain-containing protein [Actinomycetia bacterium]|nr:cupin domain-containing protein [Actinomycetes bacterium]